MIKNFLLSISFVALVAINTSAQTVKILFDASSAQMAGNADWIIDSDLFNNDGS